MKIKRERSRTFSAFVNGKSSDSYVMVLKDKFKFVNILYSMEQEEGDESTKNGDKHTR